MGMSEVRQFQTRRNFFRTQAGGIGAALLVSDGFAINSELRLRVITLGMEKAIGIGSHPGRGVHDEIAQA